MQYNNITFIATVIELTKDIQESANLIPKLKVM